MEAVKRVVNELPTIAILVVGLLGLNESDAAVWKEAAVSLSSLITWFTVRANINGPVNLARERSADKQEEAII